MGELVLPVCAVKRSTRVPCCDVGRKLGAGDDRCCTLRQLGLLHLYATTARSLLSFFPATHRSEQLTPAAATCVCIIWHRWTVVKDGCRGGALAIKV